MNSGWQRCELTYCTNVHPGETPAEVATVIQGSLAAVRQQRGLPRMGAGLWLSHASVRSLASREELKRFAAVLDENGLFLFTLNGFPAGGFHAKRVKQAVYRPDWSEPQRLEYSLDLGRILAALLPPEIAEGSISTLPLGFRPGWERPHHEQALSALCRCAEGLSGIEQETGKRIRLCLEMEPGCVLEETEHLIPLFTQELPERAAALGLESSLIGRHLGICFDVCHQAVMFEDPYESLGKIHAAGIAIGKIQISSSLELIDPADGDARSLLAGFVEEKYLHQSRCLDSSQRLHGVMDLDQAFATFPDDSPWRVHFHVPVQAQTLISDKLTTTQEAICRTLDFLRDHPKLHPHLEVETYTWGVLPQRLRPDSETRLVLGLSDELHWLETQMRQRHMLQERAP